MKYNCELCNYHSNDKANYNKHLSSKRHWLKKSKSLVSPLTSEVSPTVSPLVDLIPTQTNHSEMVEVIPDKGETIVNEKNGFSCKYCGQQYKHKQSVTKHIKYSCTKNKTEDLTELVRLLNIRLENQDKQIETQSKQIEKLMGKLEINGSFNTTVNQHINLLNYNDTDVSHLTDTDYKNCIKRVCKCVMGMIEKVHFNPNKPENMNVYISNMKDKYMMVYQNNKWMLTNKDHLDRIYDDKESMIEQWIEDNKDPEMKKFFNRYLDLKKDNKTMEMITEEIKLLMFNNKNLIDK
jgi:hypothetical protein